MTINHPCKRHTRIHIHALKQNSVDIIGPHTTMKRGLLQTVIRLQSYSRIVPHCLFIPPLRCKPPAPDLWAPPRLWLYPCPPLPACKLCLTIASAAAAAASLSFCLLRSLRYRSASGLIRRIRRIISSFGSACASFLFSSLALRIVPRLRLWRMLLLRRVPPKLGERKPAGADRRLSCCACCCCRVAVAEAIASEVRMRLSVDSK